MRTVFVAALVALSLATPTSGDDKPLWLVVTTSQLAPSIQPLAERRRSEGLDVAIVEGDPKAGLAKHPRPAYLLLLGDAPGPDEAPDPAWHVPTLELALYRWREVQRKTFASDAKWGELDGDELPDVPVGRIPARTPEEAAAVVAKILAYEDRPWTLDDLRFPMWLGAPSYGPAVDAVASMMTMTVVDSSVPRWGEPSLQAAISGSPFCGWPADHARNFDRWLRRGGLIALVGAHGSEEAFFSMDFRNEWCGYQLADVERDLAEGPPSCPMLLLSCSTGNFAAPNRCLTEALVLAPGGPVAAAGATTESHGLTNCLHGLALQRGLAAESPRLGDLWLAGLRASHVERNPLLETVLMNVEGSLEPQINVAKLRRDQVWMYALMGDPATRLRVPGKLTAALDRHGDHWRWRAERPPGADRLEVAFRAPRPKAMPKPPAKFDHQSAAAVQDQANALLAFKPTASVAADEPWEGDVKEPGEVRLVAFAADRWYVEVLQVPAD